MRFLSCGVFSLIIGIADGAGKRVNVNRDSKKGATRAPSSYPSVSPSSFPSDTPSHFPSSSPSDIPSSSPSEEGTRQFVLCKGEDGKKISSTSTVDDVEEALQVVTESLRAARTAPAATSEEFVEKMKNFTYAALEIQEQGELLWTSSVALGADLEYPEYQVTQSLIKEELEIVFLESELLLDEVTSMYSNFRAINVDPILDEVMIRLSSISRAYGALIKANDASRETAADKFRAACNERSLSSADMFYYMFGYACGDLLQSTNPPSGSQQGQFFCQQGGLGTCRGAVKKPDFLSSFMKQTISSDIESFQNFGSFVGATLTTLMFSQSVCPLPVQDTCSNMADDGSLDILHEMKSSIDEAITNIVFARSCEAECYPDGSNCDLDLSCDKCCSDETATDSDGATVCGRGDCLASGFNCGPDKCDQCCETFDRGLNAGSPKTNGTMCGECIEDNQLCGDVPISSAGDTFESTCKLCCGGNYLNLTVSQGVCGNPSEQELIILDPEIAKPEPVFTCSDVKSDKCLEAIIENGTCVEAVLKYCDDNNPMTMDTCDPDNGCVYYDYDPPEDDDERILQETSDDLLFPERLYFYDTEPPANALTDEQVSSILIWIAAEMVKILVPFCWKQSEGRGWGEPLQTCDGDREQVGLLCYEPCPDGYERVGVDCHQKCPDGFRNDGLFCRKAEFGRGVGFPWKFGDSLNDSGMYERCQNKHGRGNCEKWGAVVYPKCTLKSIGGGPGYSPFGCCICRPSTPDCGALGLNDFLDLSCAKKIEIGKPSIMDCNAGQERDGLLCYPECKASFDGIGPVCWQYCDAGRVDCGAACAKNDAECAITVVDQVLAPIIMVASLATGGLAKVPANTAKAVKIGNKFYKATKAAKRIKKIYDFSKKAKKLNTLAKVYFKGYQNPKFQKFVNADGKVLANQLFNPFYKEPFSERTSTEIDNKLKAMLSTWNYDKITRAWDEKQFVEISESEDWFTAKLALTVGGLADPTGIVDTVNAYAHPTCGDVTPFPGGLPPLLP